MTDSRSIDLSVEVPGTPEEVWDTIATGPGVGSWFVPMEVDERVGGEVVMDFGPSFGTQTATVTSWEPPNRFAYQSGGERPLAYEWLVEARDGGTCVVRLVNSGFGAGEEWDGDFDGMSNGWRLFLDNLRVHLTHFRNRRAVAIIPTVMVKGSNAAAWSALCRALGVPAGLSEGERLRASGDGVPVLSGTVHAVVRTPESDMSAAKSRPTSCLPEPTSCTPDSSSPIPGRVFPAMSFLILAKIREKTQLYYM
jgi:uncharacterized protein YndB with AHSA1/START domain